MLSQNTIKELSIKNQTRKDNIAREYIQHLFLSALYSQKGSNVLLFKEGTALRIVFHSPRFSEDLDFSVQKILSKNKLDDFFLKSISKIENQGITIQLKEAKLTSEGYLGIISYSFYDFSGEINIEISLRKEILLQKSITTIISDFLPAYVLVHLSPKEIVKGKFLALLKRHKPRDYYDLYFILRHPELNKFVDFKKISEIKEKLLKEKINFKSELEILLPISHHVILKDFKQSLITEIDKYF
ncbi:MAG: nucleotidyl transferase AbiEii/AbiGii toxin family protein [Candidatus Pacebacteria bacterium]|jgi:predicted nucleotidyltransferase component of viral defense system|nr:nucleotidyl transferase AbiEii/AbiGii toxin family protein [Candidatus Paceibacterota bacterium]MDD5535539.1 nucleotidyl transferase AbiEii/AbiGii toxin family protein [Candidatus Paceibacterota bacterium]